MSMYDELKMKVFHSGSRVTMFIGINVLIFLFTAIIGVFCFLFAQPNFIDPIIRDYFAAPTYLPKLLFRFWTPFTYIFFHDGFLHILFNMLWLYWIGRILEDFINGKKFTFIFLGGGIAGALFYIICYNLFPAYSNSVELSSIVGASAGVTAVIIATAVLLPDYTIFLLLIGPVKLKWIAIVYLVIDIISIVGPNSGGYLSHLGGAIFGFFFIKSLQRGADWSKPFEDLFKPQSKLKVVSKNPNKVSMPKNETPNQVAVDEILDKISKSGYDKLTKREKEILFNASKNDEKK
ncbi:MAG: rhomboid family intramembrane serine protease [Bacteroidetes bacterium]|nr:rhomboid family intramembrane serine protease [Bacteroidota bacterium]MBU1373519.1 rhomboid family intramembrane serine protease [Bacteroidota bacterium]MBU1485277.1 rhomboid family intramembrane serine protease [Bacteroidota bacterium]MBU1760162.1 rhomboid family intramembrane serine protease [Bacteroidota bacterium]MBU2046046.1 rhomboid family intramembrane serine protease [Bacteroidota bacterium]